MLNWKLGTPLALAALLLATSAVAETKLRVAAWNIADLHHEAGVEARPTIGTKRSNADLEKLIQYAADIDADVIALQEIATKEAAERIFGDDYKIFMSGRKKVDLSDEKSNGIYTAIAVRKTNKIKVLIEQDLKTLGITQEKDGETYSTRWGKSLLLEIGGEKLWFLSVHLKSSCSSTNKLDISTSEHCQILWQQQAPLTQWINERVEKNIPFIVAGDFNRRFRQLKDEGRLWAALNNDDLENPVLVKHPETVTRKCPTRKGKSTEPIDWILLDASIAHWYIEDSFWETRFRNEDVKKHWRRLSDHCPIHVDLQI